MPKDAPLADLGPLGCGFNTGAGTVLNELQPRIGSTLAIFGTDAIAVRGTVALVGADGPTWGTGSACRWTRLVPETS